MRMQISDLEQEFWEKKFELLTLELNVDIWNTNSVNYVTFWGKKFTWKDTTEGWQIMRFWGRCVSLRAIASSRTQGSVDTNCCTWCWPGTTVLQLIDDRQQQTELEELSLEDTDSDYSYRNWKCSTCFSSPGSMGIEQTSVKGKQITDTSEKVENRFLSFYLCCLKIQLKTKRALNCFWKV